MPTTPWDQRFFATTRGRLLQHLRRRAATVDELAQALDLTDTAIRTQLALLERDGLVGEAGFRRTSGSRKPSQEYQLTVEAERLFPKPYDFVLRQLLGVLSERFSRDDVEAAVREVGRRIGDEFGTTTPGDDPRARLGIAADALNALGGLTEVIEDQQGLYIRGFGCPLAAAVTDRAEVCRLTETFISTVSGLAVCEHCERSPSPRCRFEVVAH